VRRNERSDQLFLERMMSVVEQKLRRMKSAQPTEKTLNIDEIMTVWRSGSCQSLVGK